MGRLIAALMQRINEHAVFRRGGSKTRPYQQIWLENVLPIRNGVAFV